MKTQYIIAIIFGSIALAIFMARLAYRWGRRIQLRQWKVHDQLVPRYESEQEELTRNNVDFAKLIAVSTKEVLVDMGDGCTTMWQHEDLKYNASLRWRKRYKRAKSLMKREEWKKAHGYWKVKKLASLAKNKLNLTTTVKNNQIDE